MPCRCGRGVPALAAGIGFGRAAGERAAIGRHRALAAQRRLRAAHGRAKIHHRLREIAGTVGRSQRQHQLADLALDGVSIAWRRAIDAARHWCRPPPRARRTRSRRSPPRYSRRCPGRLRSSAAVLRKAAAARHFAGAGDEIARTGIVTEARPIRRGSPRPSPQPTPRLSASARQTFRTAESTAATVVCCSMTSLSQTR